MMMWHVKTWKFCKLKNSKYFYGKKFWQWRWENIELQRQWRHHLTFKIYIFIIVDSRFSLSFLADLETPLCVDLDDYFLQSDSDSSVDFFGERTFWLLNLFEKSPEEIALWWLEAFYGLVPFLQEKIKCIDGATNFAYLTLKKTIQHEILKPLCILLLIRKTSYDISNIIEETVRWVQH